MRRLALLARVKVRLGPSIASRLRLARVLFVTPGARMLHLPCRLKWHECGWSLGSGASGICLEVWPGGGGRQVGAGIMCPLFCGSWPALCSGCSTECVRVRAAILVRVMGHQLGQPAPAAAAASLPAAQPTGRR